MNASVSMSYLLLRFLGGKCSKSWVLGQRRSEEVRRHLKVLFILLINFQNISSESFAPINYIFVLVFGKSFIFEIYERFFRKK